jgi:hypothetical protein
MFAVCLLLAEQLQGDVAAATIRIDADYPGGNVVVEEMEGDRVRLRPDLRDTATWWFYWNFRVRGAAGRKLEFQFAGPNPIGVRGPAVSHDGGKSWAWLGTAAVDGGSFVYDFPVTAHEVRFAFAFPYHQSHLDRFLESHKAACENGRLRVETLCRSPKDRLVPLLRLGTTSESNPQRVLVAARHHACESMASFVLEGMLDAWLDPPAETDDFLQQTQVLVVPFVDCDGVEDGDQGKNRRPRDHNRDYGPDSIYRETAAIKKLADTWPAGSVRAAIDLHCPWIRGDHNNVIYMVGSSSSSMAAHQKVFGELLERHCQGPLPYRCRNNVLFGQAWNTEANFRQGVSFARWASQLQRITLATTFEIPYASAAGEPVIPESARAFGRDLARTLSLYLEGADK